MENQTLIKLDDDQMSVVDNLASMKGYVRFLDPKAYIGFDIFDEDRDQPVSIEQQLSTRQAEGGVDRCY